MAKHNFSISLVIKEMQINTNIQFFHQISNFKKTLNSKHVMQQIFKLLDGINLIYS